MWPPGVLRWCNKRTSAAEPGEMAPLLWLHQRLPMATECAVLVIKGSRMDVRVLVLFSGSRKSLAIAAFAPSRSGS